jgi:hypothetical protein
MEVRRWKLEDFKIRVKKINQANEFCLFAPTKT